MNGEELTNLDDTFYKYVVKTLARFESISSTQKLLRLLEESYFPLTLRFGGNSFAPTVEDGKAYQGIYRAMQFLIFLEEECQMIHFHLMILV